MYCSNCGKANTDNAKFCKYCGQPFTGIDHMRIQGAKSRTPLALIIVLSITIVVGGITLFSLLNSSADTAHVTRPIDTESDGTAKYNAVQGGVYITDNGTNTLVFHSNGSRFTVDGILNASQTSMDGTETAFISNNTLYYTDGTEPQVIAADIYSFALALSGNAVTYMTQMEGDQGDLYIYSNGSSDHIASNTFPNYCCISPDGKTVTYATEGGDNEEPINFIWSNGQSSQFGIGLLPVMITDGAQYIYYYSDGVFYVREGYNNGTEIELGDSVSSIAFPSDCSQVVYHNNGDAYISVSGGEGKKLSGSIRSFIIPGDTQIAVRYDSLQQPVFIYGVTGFASTFYSAGDQVYRIDESYEARMIVESAEEVELASDGRTIVFLDNGAIYRMSGLLDDARAEVWVDEDAEAVEIIAVFDKNNCYFLDFYNELCYRQESGSINVISDINSFYNKDIVLYQQFKVFYISDEKLYVSSYGEAPKLVTDLEVKVSAAWQTNNMIFAETDKGQYICVDGANFFKI